MAKIFVKFIASSPQKKNLDEKSSSSSFRTMYNNFMLDIKLMIKIYTLTPMKIPLWCLLQPHNKKYEGHVFLWMKFCDFIFLSHLCQYFNNSHHVMLEKLSRKSLPFVENIKIVQPPFFICISIGWCAFVSNQHSCHVFLLLTQFESISFIFLLR